MVERDNLPRHVLPMPDAKHVGRNPFGLAAMRVGLLPLELLAAGFFLFHRHKFGWQTLPLITVKYDEPWLIGRFDEEVFGGTQAIALQDFPLAGINVIDQFLLVGWHLSIGREVLSIKHCY